MSAPPHEADRVHARLMKFTLGVSEARAYWAHPAPPPRSGTVGPVGPCSAGALATGTAGQLGTVRGHFRGEIIYRWAKVAPLQPLDGYRGAKVAPNTWIWADVAGIGATPGG